MVVNYFSGLNLSFPNKDSWQELIIIKHQVSARYTIYVVSGLDQGLVKSHNVQGNRRVNAIMLFNIHSEHPIKCHDQCSVHSGKYNRNSWFTSEV